MKQVFITRAAGFIGWNAVLEYVKRGANIIGMERGDWNDWQCVKGFLRHPHAFLISSFHPLNDRTKSFPGHTVCPFQGSFNSI